MLKLGELILDCVLAHAHVLDRGDQLDAGLGLQSLGPPRQRVDDCPHLAQSGPH